VRSMQVRDCFFVVITYTNPINFKTSWRFIQKVAYWWCLNAQKAYQSVCTIIHRYPSTTQAPGNLDLWNICRHWDTHGNTYKKKCEEQGINMYPSVEPEASPDEGQLRDSTITSFLQPKPVKWTKEGLLEHIVELIVVEDKVQIQHWFIFIC